MDAGPSRHDPDATIVDTGQRDAGQQLDPEATLVDANASFRRTPAPPSNRISNASASAAVLEIGDLLGGRYEILQLLGEGGMGAVYKAADRELDRFVALKVIRPELASNPSILARFKQELLLAHQVTHRNVIRIYDLGEAEGVKFITMEFIEGKDLRSLIREKKKFAPEEAVDVIQQVCQALDAAHSVGVIHRDLKPQNIMQDGSGRILVMDFGLARTLEGDGMTQTGAHRRHHGVHVAGAGSGQGSRSTFRHFRSRSDLVRNADGQSALSGRERSGQPHQTDAGTCDSGVGY